MCEPATIMLALGAGAGLLSAGAGLYGSASASDRIESDGRAAQEQAGRNATLAETAGRDALARGEQEAMKHGFESKQLEGAQLTGMGASGVDVQSASFMDLMSGSAAMSALDVATTRNNAAREAWGYREQATNLRRGGDRARKNADDEASSTFLGGAMQAGASAAGTAAGVYARRPSLK